MKQFYFILIVLVGIAGATSAQASSWKECHLIVKVESYTEGEAQVDLIKFREGQGMSGELGQWDCIGTLKEFKVKDAAIAEGKELIKEGTVLRALSRAYSAMGEDGPVEGLTWKFSPALEEDMNIVEEVEEKKPFWKRWLGL